MLQLWGAVETTSVDLAKRSRELSTAHFEANGFSMENHRLVVMDVFDYFKYAKKKGLFYDLIVIDPPCFARNKKRTFSANKDYHKLIAQSLDILSEYGTIIASTNAANMTVQQFKSNCVRDWEMFQRTLLTCNNYQWILPSILMIQHQII